MDTLTSMAVFNDVVEAASFTGAARKLGMSKSSVSKHVAALESRLGLRLLHRTTRKLSLTEAGAVLYEQATRIVAEAAEAETLVTQLHAKPRGLLRVNAPIDFGRENLSPILPAFLAHYPDITLDLTLNDRYVDLVDEGFDLAIRIAKLRDSSLVARKIADNRMIICAAPSYLERHGTPATPDDLAGHDCLIYSYASAPNEWILIGPDGKRNKVRVASRFISNNGGAMRTVLLGGAGIVAAPAFMLGADVRAGRLQPILQEYSLGDASGIYIVYPHGRFVPAKVRAFITHVVAAFGPVPPWEMAEEETIG